MSSKVATEFGEVYQEEYQDVLEKWGKKLSNIKEVGPEIRTEWNADMQEKLGEPVIDGLKDHALPRWKKVGNLPSPEVLEMYAQIATKGALAADTGDLLGRLNDSSSVTEFAVQVPTLIKRAHQTVAQIFDMAQDRFNRLVENNLQRSGQITGRRRWVTVPSKAGGPSRHASLNGTTKRTGELFSIDGEEVYGPRPPGGAPENWSNCSCRLEYQQGNRWI